MGNRRPEGDTPLERSLDRAVAAGDAQLSKMFEQRDELAALQRRLAESEAQRAVLVGALGELEHGLVVANGYGAELDGLERIAAQALATQPPSDLVALVRAADRVVGDLGGTRLLGTESAESVLKAALDALLTNQPGWLALIESEDVCG